MNEALKVVVSGSFRNFASIREAIRAFKSLGAVVLSPADSALRSEGDEFIYLESDPKDATPSHLESAHLAAIARADVLYICAPEGYVGLSTALEAGWGMALGKPVYASEPLADVALRSVVPKAASPSEVVSELKRCTEGLPEHATLEHLQKYVAQVARQRGFSDETAKDKLLLAVEEFGELASALRKRLGLKVASDTCDIQVAQELADILFYVLDLSNVCGVSLAHAFQAKERLNRTRTWRSSQ